MLRFRCAISAALIVMMFTSAASAFEYKDWHVPPEADIVNKYEKLEDRMNNAIVLKTGSRLAYVNNRRTEIAIQPELIDGEIYVPVRCIAQALGGVVEWDKDKNSICIMYSNSVINIKPGSDAMMVKYEGINKVKLEKPVFSIQDFTVLPVKKYMEALNKTVYTNDDGLIFISDKQDTFTEGADDEQIEEALRLFDYTYREPRRLYVEPGSGGGNGSICYPFKGIAAAKNAVKKYLTDDMDRDIEVLLMGGTYEMDENLVFDSSDSGRNHHTVTYKNYNDQEVVITFGKKISIWTPYKDNIWQGRVDEGWNIDSLFDNGKRCTMARTPNDKWAYMISDEENINKYFHFRDEDVTPTDDTSNLETVLWGMDCFVFVKPVLNINFETNRTELTDIPYTGYSGVRYYMQGSYDWLDAPGEFYNNRKGKIYYIPENGDPRKSDIEAPTVKGYPIKFTGSSPTNPCKNITFDGLTIKNSSAAYSMIMMVNARNITITNCDIHNAGTEGLEISSWNQNIDVTNNHIYNIGHTGVMLYGTEGKTTAYNRNHRIINNYIHDVGQIRSEGSGVHIYESKGNIVKNNLIHTTGRYCISLAGWDVYTWGGRGALKDPEPTFENRNMYSHMNDCLIAYNDCYSAGLDSSDTGPINLWNVDPGNIVYNNRVHDSSTPFGFNYGIYLDDRCDNTLVKNNIVDGLYTSKSGGKNYAPIMVKGSYNEVINNFLINNRDAAMGAVQHYPDDYTEKSKVSLKNIFFNSGKNIYHFTNWRGNELAASDNNVYYNDSGIYTMEGAPVTKFDEWKNILSGKFDNHSVTENPMFVDVDNTDYRLKYNSPAFALGIENIDISKIGLQKEYKYGKINEEVQTVYAKEKFAAGEKSYVNLVTGQSVETEVSAKSKSGYMMELKHGDVSYTSEDESIATIDKNGVITAVAPGKTAVNVTVSKNGSSKSCAIDVLVDDYITEISFNNYLPIINLGETFEFDAAAKTKLGRILKLDAADVEISLSDNLSFTKDNKIRAKGLGEAKITVKTVSNGKEFVGEQTYEVVESKIGSVSITGGSNVLCGSEYEYGITVTRENGDVIDPSEYTVECEEANGIELQDITTSRIKAVSNNIGINTLKLIIRWKGMIVKASATTVTRPTEIKLSDGWKFANIGNSEGFPIINEDGTVSIVAWSGSWIWSDKDKAAFLYKEYDASEIENGISISCTVNPFILSTSSNNCAGIMIRNSLDPGADEVNIKISSNGTCQGIYRNAEQPNTWYVTGGKKALPNKLRLSRNGNVVTMETYNGEAWNPIKEIKVSETDKLYIGLTACEGGLSQALLSDVEIEKY